jgi:O-antigen/teichoic acid export membrane protein
MSRTLNVSRNIKWGVFNKCVAMIVPFISRTVMIYTLGTLYLGLNGLLISILQVLSVSELGISSAIVFSMYKPLAGGKNDEVCALLNFYKKCYRIIGGIVLVLGLIILPFLHKLISGEIPLGINLYVVYLMNLFCTVLSYELYTYKTSLLVAIQRNDIISKIASVLSVFQLVLQTIALVLLKNYYAFILISILITISNNIVVAIMSKKMYPQYYCRGHISNDCLRDIKQKVSGMIFQKIGGAVLSSVDTIVISAFLGLTSLALYQNYYYIITSLFGILTVIMNSLIATIGNSVVLESVEKNYYDFKKFNYIYIWIVSWFTICLLCLYQPFMRIWVGEDLMLPFGMVILFAVYFFVFKWCDMLYVYQEACGIWWETKFVPLTAAIVNLVINLILVNIIGLPGILISTIISVVFIYDVGYAKVLFKVYFNIAGSMKEYIVKQIFYLGCTLVTALITVCLCNAVVLNSYLQIIFNAVICLVVPNLLLYLFWHRLPEFSEAKKLGIGIIKWKIKPN